MNSLRPTLIFGAIWILLSCSCTQKGCREKAEIESTQDEKKISAFPTLNFGGLNAQQKNSLIKLFNAENCLSGCNRTFAEGLVANKECVPSRLLAQWTINQLKAGAPELQLFEIFSEETNSGYMSKQATIDTGDAYFKGNDKARITIVEFADFECPACKIASKAMSSLIKEKGDEVKLYFMHFPLSGHEQAEPAAVAAEAAGRQGKFWEMHDLLFNFEGQLNSSVLDSLGKKIFKTPEKYSQYIKDRADPVLLEKVRKNKQYAMKELKLMKTPSFYFNGRLYNLSLAEDGFLLRIAMENARTGIECESGQK